MTWRRILLNPLSCGVAVVALTAAYLAGPARDSMDATAAVAILVHLSVGFLLIAPAAWVIFRAIRHRSDRAALIFFACLSIVAGMCALTGIYATLRAAAGHSTATDTAPGVIHSLGGILSVAIVLVYCWRITRHHSGSDHPIANEAAKADENSPAAKRAPTASFLGAPEERPGTVPAVRSMPSWSWLLACAMFLTVTQGALFGAAALLPMYNAQEYYRDLTATTADQAQNPLFPAGMRLQNDALAAKVDSRVTLPDSTSCGVEACHPTAYREWHESAHRFAGSDPLYLASLKESVRTSGPDIRGWCQGCHAPAEVVRQRLRPASDGLNGAESEGVGCYTCHATTGTPARTGNGRFVLAEPRDYPFEGAADWRGRLHDFLLRVRPAPHQRAYLKPELHRSSEFCSGCHRQSLTLAQNHYQFVRGPDEYGEWARGPASARNARNSRLGTAQTCQDCHFRSQTGVDGRQVSHTAPGGISTLGEHTDIAASSEATELQLRRAISLDLIAIRQLRSDGRPGEVIAPLDSPRETYALTAGTGCFLDIVVRNQGVGHSFPAGYADLTEAWLEVTIASAHGTPILSNGVPAGSQTEIPRDAHVYGALGLDRRGEPILRHDLPAQVTEAYHRTIPSGGADIARYRFVVPPRTRTSAQGRDVIRISARLRYRSVRPDFMRWALGSSAGSETASAGGSGPRILTLAETEIVLPLAQSKTEPGPVAKKRTELTAERFMHYGEGLLAPASKPDIGGALYAYRRATELARDRPEPWIGLGRTYLREPDLRAAERNFEAARILAPGNPGAMAELSVVYRKQGQFQRAAGVLAPLIESFPNDAALHYEMGLAKFGAGRYSEAADSLRSSLAIDPDQYDAHKMLKLCCEVLRRVPEGRLEDSILRYMGEDILSARLVPAYLKKHPDDAHRAEPFPIHTMR